MMIENIIFDVGGTLIDNYDLDFDKGFLYLYYDVFNLDKRGILDKDEFLNFCFELLNEISKRDICNIETSFRSILNYLTFIYGERVYYNYDKIELTFSRLCYKIKIKDNVINTLNYFKSLGIKMYILSNSMFSSKVIINELERMNINHYFDYVVSSSNYLFRKPSYMLFKAYIKKIGATNSSILMVGNDIDKDIVPASNIGMKSFLIKDSSDYLLLKDYINGDRNGK